MTDLMEAIQRSPYRYKWVNGNYYRTHKATKVVEIFDGSWRDLDAQPNWEALKLELERIAA